jgi:hypothetical protein
MYEGRNAHLFAPTTGIITWMSNPAQPSFVWQLYHYDLEPNSSLFAVKSASEPVHIQMNEVTGNLQVINNLPQAIAGDTAHVAVYSVWGGSHAALETDVPVSGPADTAIDLGPTPLPNWSKLYPLYLIKLDLRDAQGQIVSRNLYWKPLPSMRDDLTTLNSLPTIKLDGTIARHDAGDRLGLEVTLKNSGAAFALMAHLQLRRKSSGDRILPVFYSDNYVWLAPGESRTIAIDAALADLKGDTPLVVVDGWNVDVTPVTNADCALAPNVDAQVSHWPATGLPMITAGLPGASAPHGTQ